MGIFAHFGIADASNTAQLCLIGRARLGDFGQGAVAQHAIRRHIFGHGGGAAPIAQRLEERHGGRVVPLSASIGPACRVR